jgi:hypothetical protein
VPNVANVEVTPGNVISGDTASATRNLVVPDVAPFNVKGDNSLLRGIIFLL